MWSQSGGFAAQEKKKSSSKTALLSGSATRSSSVTKCRSNIDLALDLALETALVFFGPGEERSDVLPEMPLQKSISCHEMIYQKSIFLPCKQPSLVLIGEVDPRRPEENKILVKNN